MPRGGARPGAGRKPTKPKAEKPPKLDKDGYKTDASWPFGQVRPEEPKPAASAPEPDLSSLMPLDYMLSVIRDKEADPARRMQAAFYAAPYCHSKKGETGKKEQKNAAAKQVAGRFAPVAPPRLAAANGKNI